jgi:hypothetical protein
MTNSVAFMESFPLGTLPTSATENDNQRKVKNPAKTTTIHQPRVRVRALWSPLPKAAL